LKLTGVASLKCTVIIFSYSRQAKLTPRSCQTQTKAFKTQCVVFVLLVSRHRISLFTTCCRPLIVKFPVFHVSGYHGRAARHILTLLRHVAVMSENTAAARSCEFCDKNDMKYCMYYYCVNTVVQ